MNILAWNNMPALAAAGLRNSIAGLALVLLSSCGGGESGIDIGGGQSVDPVVVDFQLVYVKRPMPVDDQTNNIEQSDLRELLPVEFGSDLWIRDRASPSADEMNITGSVTGGFGDIRDVSISFNGERVLFAMRTPIDPDADDEDQPTWNIWEYDIPSDVLRRIMVDDITAEEGHDVGPHYLPDGRIVFTSTRQNRTVAKLLDQGKQQFSALDDDRNEIAFVLHVMDADGGNIVQTSFNQSHDLYPTVLSNGRVLFSRWDAMNSQNAISLYHANPDGSDMQMLYGADSHATGTNSSIVEFAKPKELPDGQVIALLMPFSGTSGGGDLINIDVATYINQTQPTAVDLGVLTGPAQVPATVNSVSTIPGPSPGGRYAAVWPLWDGTNRAIVSYSPCRVQFIDPADPLVDRDTLPRELCTPENLANPQAVEGYPSYGVYVYDFNDDTQKPVAFATPGMMFTDVAIAQPRALPPIIPDLEGSGAADPNLIVEDAGLLNIRSVYDEDGVDTAVPDIPTLADPTFFTADQRPARFVRIYKAVGIPDEEVLDLDGAAFGRAPQFGMREIVGYAPVEPDGSVMIKVPADTPFAVDVLDADGHRIGPRHRNWMQVRPGEVLQCNGCHDPNLPDVSHGRSDSFLSVYAGAAGNGVPFPGTDPLAYPTINFAETMAEARVTADPTALEQSADIIYTDVWTYEPVAGRPADLPYSFLYSDIVATPAPDLFDCVPWTVDCRVLINYENHIQPLWDVSRPIVDPDTLLEIGNNRCTDCHALRNVDNELIDPDDRGQLELTSDASAAEPLHFISYRELLFGDNREVLDNGAIQEDLQFQGNFDVDGNPLLEPVPIAAPLSPNGANAAPLFFSRFEAGGAHPNWLSAAELRLIAEWLDLGAQYYNNPFDGPVN